MPTEKKIEQVKELTDRLNEYQHLVVTDYRGMSVQDITDLRAKLSEKGVVYQVVKNNLVKIALKGHNIEGLDEYLFGPTAIAFAKEEAVSTSKILIDFAKDTKLEVKAGYSEGRAMGIDEVTALSKLPSKEILVGKMLGSMMSPIQGVVGVLTGPMRSLVNVLDQISKKES